MSAQDFIIPIVVETFPWKPHINLMVGKKKSGDSCRFDFVEIFNRTGH